MLVSRNMLHAFQVVGMLTDRNHLTEDQTVTPIMVTDDILADVHTQEYIHEINTSSKKVAQVVELWPVAWLPAWLVNRCLVEPMKHHVAGTMVAAALAIETGWSINIGGGMHHGHRFDGDGKQRPSYSRTLTCTAPSL